MNSSLIDPATAACVREWSTSLGRRTPTRTDIETILVQLAFQDELVLEAACGLPEAEQAVRIRLDRVTEALMALIEGRQPAGSTGGDPVPEETLQCASISM